MNRSLNIYVMQKDRPDIRALFKATEAHQNQSTAELALNTGAEILSQTPEGTRVMIECTEENDFQFLLSLSRVGMNLQVVASFKDSDQDSIQAEEIREQIAQHLEVQKRILH